MSSAPFRPALRLGGLGVSPILQIGARATALKRQGRPVIILGAGEPDFDTPQHIQAAATAAMHAGATRYTALDGTPELKQAICEKFRRDNGLEFDLGQISVGTGAKQVLYNALMATLDPGDEVIIPVPAWTSYADMVDICGGRPVLVPTSGAQGFRLDAAALEAAITPRTRWLMLNSPSNPTGSAYARADYQPLLGVLLRHPGVWLLVDDIYEHIVYDGFRFVTPAQLEPRLRERILTVNGVSKAYAMTGWRIGYGAGPQALIQAMAVVQSQSTSCPSAVSQAAACAALNGPQDCIERFVSSFQARRDLVVSGLNRIDGIQCRQPEGAFYAYASCAGLLGRCTPAGTIIDSDNAFCDWLLDAHDVAVVPGSAFGLSPYFRISYASATRDLEQACERIANATQDLAPR